MEIGRAAGLDQALHILASIPYSALRSLGVCFRNGARRRHFSAAQRREIALIAPDVAARLYATGRPASDYTDSVRRAGAALALLDAPEDTLNGFLDDFDTLAKPTSGETRLALHHLVAVVRLELSLAYRAVEAGERQLIEAVRRAWRYEATLHDVWQTVLEALRNYSGAAGGHLETWAGGGVPTVSGGVWSIPFGLTRIRLEFEQARRIRPRERRLLISLATECSLPGRAISAAVELQELLRARIARELHDDLAQELGLLRLRLELEDAQDLHEFAEIADASMAGLRRMMSGISRPVIESIGIIPLISRLMAKLEASHGMRCRFSCPELPELSLTHQTVIYRLIQECLSNVERHSLASALNISFRCTDTLLSVSVEDNGIGFDLVEAQDKPRCYGLSTMRAVLDLLGGSLTVYSDGPKANRSDAGIKGTRVVIHLPLNRGFRCGEIM